MRNNFKAIDLFCGVGGSSYGATKAGVQVVAGFDIWEPATKVYSNNFPKAKIFHNDIRDLSPKKIKDQIGAIDIILASPECTNHSVAKGGKERCEESKRTAFQVTRFAKEFRPKWIILENVIQMSSWSEHSRLIEELWSLDYFVKEVKLDAQYFGVPQSRKRLFLICSLTEDVREIEKRSKTTKTVNSILDKSNQYEFTELFKKGRSENTLERAERAINALGKKEPFLLVYYGTDGSGGWQRVDKPLRTITTIDRFAYVNPTSKGHMLWLIFN
jgi:DNA (cytosine-5)-methyltransferase 1